MRSWPASTRSAGSWRGLSGGGVRRHERGGPAGLDIRRCYQEARTASQTASADGGGRILRYDEVSLEFLADSIAPDIRRDLVSPGFLRLHPGGAGEHPPHCSALLSVPWGRQADGRDPVRPQNTVHYHLQRIQALHRIQRPGPQGIRPAVSGLPVPPREEDS